MSFILILVIGVVGWILYTQYLKKLLAQGKAGQIKLALIVAGLLFLLMAATGRAPALFAVLGAALTQIMRIAPLLIRFAPFLKRYLGTGAAAATGSSAGAQQSRVDTHTITMSLDHATGGVTGQVLAGEFTGRPLASLSVNELQSLYAYCVSQDIEAVRLLETYISRERIEEWQASGGQSHAHETGDQPIGASTMSVAEARQVLGLPDELTNKNITAAHRTLMGRFHPDKGGNDYIATKINTARAVLMDSIQAGE